MFNQKRELIVLGTIAITVVVLGIMAGFFWSYTFNVNLAMLQVSGETYATVQTLFNQKVRHFMFFVFFFGGGLLPVIAISANIRHRKTLSFWLIAIAALVYIVGVIAFTKQVNLPISYFTESWQPANLPDNWAATRDAWNQANAVRVGTSFLAFVMALLALVLRKTH